MSIIAQHRLGVFLSFCCGMLLLPALLFWGVNPVVSGPSAVVVGFTLAALRHCRPHLFDAEMGDPDPKVIAGQETARARISMTTYGTYL